MAYLNPRVLDLGLAVLDTEATHLHVCSAEPASFAAVAGASLGNGAASVGAPADATPSGRKVTVAATSIPEASADGTASHWALVDATNSRLLATGALEATQVITSGNPLNVDPIDIRLEGVV